MKFNLVVRQDAQSQQIADNLVQQLQQHQLIRDELKPDIVISVGGDGTFLQAFHQYTHLLHHVKFMGLHTGHLGFFADWSIAECQKLVDILVTGQDLAEVTCPLLEVIITRNNGDKRRYLALNESTIKSYDNTTFVADVFLKNTHFESFRGDGLCLCTPSGSTAYNKSLGGAIMDISLDAIQLTEMASINNRIFRTIGSPLIFPKHQWCMIQPKVGQIQRVSVDHISFKIKDIKTIKYRVATERIILTRYKEYPFWERVRRAFIDEDNICHH